MKIPTVITISASDRRSALRYRIVALFASARIGNFAARNAVQGNNIWFIVNYRLY